MCKELYRDFLSDRDSNVKKGNISSLISNITITINYRFIYIHTLISSNNKIHAICLYMHTLYKDTDRCKHVTMIDIVNRLCGHNY